MEGSDKWGFDHAMGNNWRKEEMDISKIAVPLRLDPWGGNGIGGIEYSGWCSFSSSELPQDGGHGRKVTFASGHSQNLGCHLAPSLCWATLLAAIPLTYDPSLSIIYTFLTHLFQIDR